MIRWKEREGLAHSRRERRECVRGLSSAWRRGAGTGGGLGQLRSMGQVGMGGGCPDWGSKVVSAPVVLPRLWRRRSAPGAQTGLLFAKPAKSAAH